MDPFDLSREDVDFERLGAELKALAHPARLELLWRLRVPASSAEVVVRPRRRDADLSQDRPMTRQSIEGHLEVMEEVGVVGRVPQEEAGGAAHWVTSNQRVFALIEDLRKLTAIRPATKVDVDATFPVADAAPAPEWTTGPKLVLVSGPWEGRAFALDGEGPWTVGRSRAAAVALSYDPFASAEHARVVRRGSDLHAIEALPEARNATRVNFQPVAPAAPRPLAPGDVVGVGRSLLVYQPR